MTEAYKTALVDLLYQLADDDLVFGHRSAEWLGLAPDLEEDIAFSSIAQDEVGHAAFFYSLIAELTNQDADTLAFARPSQERKNASLLEQPNGDWAYTIARGFVYNTFEQVRLEALLVSNYSPLQQGVRKILREERYHVLHLETWFERLGVAGGEARKRVEDAVKRVWDDLQDLFSLGQFADALAVEGIMPVTREHLATAFDQSARSVFERAGMIWPEMPLTHGETDGVTDGRLGQHTEHLDELLSVMTEVYRSEDGSSW
ncbi:hypothetical protein AN477_06050 [Alicyclobacillus ferrooxydans]|uniref:Phenylacetate-CoA oxygenase n=2 Tax=Alicyclobacillus ferrooxydans TaxID=471514 RepID=A0A0P9EMP2_9BACL|nr:hypothetical protein AN477_06050 [Alicyclobacillus ferrooxydans]